MRKKGSRWLNIETTNQATIPICGRRSTLAHPIIYWAIALVPITQAVVILWLIWTRSSALPFWDEWFTVDLVRLMDECTLSWRELWAFHNEHRIVVPRIVNLLVIQATGWNRQVEMTINLIISGSTLGLLLSSLRRSCRPIVPVWIAIAPFSLLVLSHGQYENWLEPFQIAFIATAFGIALCVRGFVTNTDAGWYGFALGGAILASLSSLGGLAVWPAFLPAACAMGRRKAIVWCMVALMIILPYIHDMPTQGTVSGPGQARIAYTLVYLGMPVAYPFTDLARLMSTIGIVVLACALIVHSVTGGERRILLIWAGLIAHGAGCALMTSLGRDIRTEFVPSRYQIFAAEWWLGILAIAGLAIIQWRQSKRSNCTAHRMIVALVASMGCIVLLLCSGGLLQANRSGLQSALQFQKSQRASQECMRDPLRATEACLRVYYPGQDWENEHVPERADYLRHTDRALYR